MLAEQYKSISTSKKLRNPDPLSGAITLCVGLSNIAGPLAIDISIPLYARIVKMFERSGVEPKFITSKKVVFILKEIPVPVTKIATVKSTGKQSQKIETRILTDKRKEAFGKFYSNYYPRIHSFIWSRLSVPYEDIDDLTQKTFENAWKHFTLNTNFPNTFPDVLDAYLPLLYRIAHSLVINSYRDIAVENRRIVELADEEDLTYIRTQDSTLVVEKREEQNELLNAISLLPNRYQLVIWLKMGLQLSNKEVASLIGSTEGSVKIIYHRATRKLRKTYSQISDFESLH